MCAWCNLIGGVSMALRKFILFRVCDPVTLLFLTVLGFCGCAAVGPQSITAGRGAYNEVINRTEDEQIMNVLVRLRYDETFDMLSVASITANLRISAEAATDIGIGNSDNYAGNLVPFSAGIGYEENPTISYVPLSGEDFTRRMLAPVSISEWILLGQNARHPGHVLSVTAKRINGLRNPFLEEGPPSPEFEHFVELYDRLRRVGVLDIVQVSRASGKGRYFLIVHDYKDAHYKSVRELLDLIGIEANLDGSTILLPIREAVDRSVSEIHIQTRSAYDVLRLFGAGIEVPAAHLEAGIVEPIRSAVLEERQLFRIHSSKQRPDNATVRIRYRDWWFYIDDADAKSKRSFRFLRTFIGMRLADQSAAQRAPVITIPVK